MLPLFNIVVLSFLITTKILWCESARIKEINPYRIPQPKIEVFAPKGFRVSIEHTPGIRSFAFHGSVNVALPDFDDGTLSKETQRPQNERWIIEEKYTRLRIGDTLNYWVFVIKDNVGYRLNGQSFCVKELLPSPYLPAHSPSTKESNVIYEKTTTPEEDPLFQQTTTSYESSPGLMLCEQTIVNNTQVIISLRNELDNLKKLNKQLLTALEEYPGSKQIKLSSDLLPEGTAISTTQFILREKLNLAPKIVWAVREDTNTIVFEVSSVMEKFEIISVAKEQLKNSTVNLT